MKPLVLLFYKDEKEIPVRDWLDSLPDRAYAKAVVRVERLAELGHELHRPEADYLKDGIYELRWRLGHVNYRILYFFAGADTVVLAHGCTKEGKVPAHDIALALKRKTAFLEDSEGHTHYEEPA
jgi:phage-related protein